MTGIEAIVVEYRSPERTRSCVRSLLDNGVTTIHVVDNSNDKGKTRAILQSFFGGNPRIKIFDTGGNIGFAAGVNAGMLQCTSPFILLINNDATLNSTGALSLLRALLEKPHAVIAFPSLTHAGRPLRRVFYHPWLIALTGWKVPGSYEVPRGCCMMLARDRFNEKLFDERFFMYGEELQLGLRLRHRPGALVWVESARVEHEGSASSVLGSRFYEERTALAHLLLNADLMTAGPYGSARVAFRHVALLMRALLRTLRHGTLTPLFALNSARRHMRSRDDQTPPPA